MLRSLFVCLMLTSGFFTAVAQGQNPAIVIRPETPDSFRAGIIAAAQNGQNRIVVPAGTYEIPPSQTGYNLEFADLKNLEIEANGVTLLMTDNTRGGVLFNRCQNVTLRGATIRNATPPFTQGVIEEIATDRKSFVLHIHQGYPATLNDAQHFNVRTSWYIFDAATRRLKNGTGDYGNAGIERIDDNRWRILFGNPLGQEIAVGDLTATRGRGGTGLHNEHCAGMRIENVSVQYSGGFGFFETWGDGANVYRGIQVKPGPKPTGAIEEPLMSENADAFHSAATKTGPTIENSFFTRMPDDGIAIHGYYQLIRQVNGRDLVFTQPWASNPYEVGDRVGFVSAEGVPIGEAKVTATENLTDNLMPPITSDYPHFRDNRFFFRLTLDKTMPLPNESFCSNLDHMGSGYILRNNTIIDHRARGLLLKAHNGLVENNFIDGSSIAGIVLGPELWWGEADYSQNVTIRGNTVTHVGYATTGPWNKQAGALTLLGERDAPETRGHQNITIENNTFDSIDGVNLLLDGLENSVVRGNRFLSPRMPALRRGADRGIAADALIFVDRARNVRFENNTVINAPSQLSLLKTTEHAAQIEGQTGGVSIPDTAGTFSYTNPLNFSYEALSEQRREVRDPAIIRDGDTYYMTFTMWPFRNREDKNMSLPDNGSSPGIQLFSSKDLKNWKAENWLVKSSDLPENSPYKHRFWAPEIHKFNGKYYLIFTADNWLKPEYNPAGRWGSAGYAFVGVADKITGPYQHITYIPEAACDTTLMQDKDGIVYAVMPKYNLFIRPLDLSGLERNEVKWLGPEKLIVNCSSADSALPTTPNYLEGPWVERIGDKYLLFYAEFFLDPQAPQKASYWTGVAYADNPLGPWTKDPRGKVFEGGHLAVFDGPDNRKWFSYRRETAQLPERGTPAIDPLDIDAQGRVLTNPPSASGGTVSLSR